MIEIKPLELSKHGSWFKRNLWSRHAKKTYLGIVLGATGGFLYYYLTEGMHTNEITGGDISNSLLIGAFLGFFLTNSPCARGAC